MEEQDDNLAMVEPSRDKIEEVTATCESAMDDGDEMRERHQSFSDCWKLYSAIQACSRDGISEHEDVV